MIMPSVRKTEPELDDPRPATPASDTWEDDQLERSYYYDDAHGYEKYDPDREDDEEPDENGRHSDCNDEQGE